MQAASLYFLMALASCALDTLPAESTMILTVISPCRSSLSHFDNSFRWREATCSTTECAICAGPSATGATAGGAGTLVATAGVAVGGAVGAGAAAGMALPGGVSSVVIAAEVAEG